VVSPNTDDDQDARGCSDGSDASSEITPLSPPKNTSTVYWTQTTSLPISVVGSILTGSSSERFDDYAHTIAGPGIETHITQVKKTRQITEEG
jgi:hypothetical protein